jgi:CRP-like cAMP-binding protein
MVRDASSGCLLRCVAIPAYGVLPVRWGRNPEFALVRRGIVVRQRIDAAGGATAVDAVGPGGLLPLRDASERGTAIYAAADAMLCVCTAKTLNVAVESSTGVARDVIRLQALALDRVERIGDARGRKTAAGRVAALLGALSDTLSPHRQLDVVPAGLRQRDLGALLALRHESVCRELGRLERSGATARVAEGIRIVDRAKLEAVA